MHLKRDKRSNGRTYPSAVKSFRGPFTKKPRQKALLSLGFLDELSDKYQDPIAHFKGLA